MDVMTPHTCLWKISLLYCSIGRQLVRLMCSELATVTYEKFTPYSRLWIFLSKWAVKFTVSWTSWLICPPTLFMVIAKLVV